MRSAFGRVVFGGIVAGFVGVTSFAAFAQTAPQGGVLERLRKAGVVKVALVNAPPYGTLAPDGTVGGLGPTVVKTVMARLGVPKVEGIISTYGELIPGLQAGRWDIIGATMTITPARCQQVTFSDPEFIEGLGFAYSPSEVPSVPKSIKEIGEKLDRIGVKTGSNELSVMQASAAAGRKGTVSQFQDNAAMLEGLQSKRVQLVVGGIMVLRAERERRNNAFEVIYPMPDDILRGQSGAFRPGDKDLIDAYQAELRKMKASGELAKMVTSFGFDVLPGAMEMTNEQACKIE